MNDVGRNVLLMFALSVALMGMSQAAWRNLPNFGNSYNVSNVTWIYSQGTFNAPASAVAVTLNSLMVGTGINVTGYSSTMQPLGNVRFYLLSQMGNNAVILLLNQTVTGSPWSMATIYYNGNIHATSSFWPMNGSMYHHTSVSVVPSLIYSSTFKPPAFYNTTANGNFNFIAASSCTTILIIIQSCTQLYGRFVMVSNKNLAAIGANISWYPNSYNLYNISSQNGMYQLYTFGIAGNKSSVSNSPVSSHNANYIFLNQTSGGGFEAYFAQINNVVASEGMAQTDGHIYNSIPADNQSVLLACTYLLCPTLRFNFEDSNSFVPQSVLILPPFTTIARISPPASNPNYNPTGIACSGGLSCYQYLDRVTQLQWVYNYSTLATGNVLHTNPLWFNFSTGVNYAIITFPHVNSLQGDYCNDLFVDDYINSTNTDYGPVPFYILNCSPQYNQAQILIPNETTVPYLITNSVDIFFDSVSGSGAPSNTQVFNAWQLNTIISGQDAQVWNYGPPLVINISAPLTLTSYMEGVNSYAGWLFNSSLSHWNLYIPFEHVTSTYSPTSFLYAKDVTYAANLYTWIIASKPFLLGAIVNGGGCNSHYNISNYTTYYNTCPTLGGIFSQFYVSLTGINGTARYLYTTRMTVTGIYTNPLFNKNLTPNLPQIATFVTTIPQTSNGLNYNNTTTLNFNTSNTPSNSIFLGDTGLAIPIIAIYALQIMLLLIILAAIEEEHPMAGIAMLAIIWMIGLFKVQLLVLPVIATLLVIVDHFIMEERRKGRRPPDLTNIAYVGGS